MIPTLALCINKSSRGLSEHEHARDCGTQCWVEMYEHVHEDLSLHWELNLNGFNTSSPSSTRPRNLFFRSHDNTNKPRFSWSAYSGGSRISQMGGGWIMGGHQPIIWPNPPPPKTAWKWKKLDREGTSLVSLLGPANSLSSCPNIRPWLLSDSSPIHKALAFAISNICGFNTLLCHVIWPPFQVRTDQNTVEPIAIADCQCEHDLMVKPLRYIISQISFRMISCPTTVAQIWLAYLVPVQHRFTCLYPGSTEPMSISDWETHVSQPLLPYLLQVAVSSILLCTSA